MSSNISGQPKDIADNDLIDLPSVLDGMPQGMAVFDRHLRLVTWNRQFHDLLGLSDDFLKKTRSLHDFLEINRTHTDDEGANLTSGILAELAKANLSDDLFAFCYEYKVCEDRNLEVRGNVMPERGLVVTYMDITARTQAKNLMEDSAAAITNQLMETEDYRQYMESQAASAVQMAEELAVARQEAEASARQVQAVLNAMADGLVTLDLEGHILTNNNAVQDMFGYTSEEIIGKSLFHLLNSTTFHSPQDLVDFLASMKDMDQEYKRKETAIRANASTFPVELAVREVSIGTSKQYTVLIRDVTERYEAEAMIRQMALHDSLTGLANRNLLQQRLDEALKMAQRLRKKIAVMFLDLDLFKPVNDIYGHAAGDKLLRVVAERLTECAREVDTVARLGGDEFAIIFTNLGDEFDITDIAQRILDSIQEPITIDSNVLQVGTSIGISFFPHDSTDPDELIRMADVALYQAKDHGRRIYRLYDPEMDAAAKEEKNIELDLIRALKNNEFILHYQPQLDAIDYSLAGAEALIRWQHPEKGMIPPFNFITIAESSNIIIELGQWILDTACKQAKIWEDAGLPPFRVCINISARQFQSKDFIQSVEKSIELTGVNPEWLELEITEGMVLESSEAVIHKLEKLSELGITLAIDDFGTGYSSLAYLKRFPVHQLKIDQSFIRDIAEDHDDAAITDAVIRLGHSLGLKVVAEGVETEEHVHILRQKGCDVLQGYFFSKPVPVDEFEAWMKKNNARA